MHSCTRCMSFSQECKILSESDCCEECICMRQSCELAISSQEFDCVNNEICCLCKEKLAISQKK